MQSTIDNPANFVAPVEPVRLAWIREQLANIKFQNWTFELDDNGPDLEPLVTIRFVTMDSTKPGEPFIAEAAYRVEDMPTTPKGMALWALASVSHAMMHEVAETLTFGGQQVLDPHAPGNRQWDGALYERICEMARGNGNPFYGVLYADAAALYAANAAADPESLTRGECHKRLIKEVTPRRYSQALSTEGVEALAAAAG